jgi:hypothetical protein
MSGLIPAGYTAKQARKFLEHENRNYPDTLVTVPETMWRPIQGDTSRRIRVLRSRRFMVQVFDEANGVLRMSVNRTTLAKGGEQWEDGIAWEDLQELKRQAGYGDRFAVEIYPKERDEVNVANLRHLWILTERLPFGWVACLENAPKEDAR